MEYVHTSILVEEIVDFLQIRPDSVLVDATCGEGGHSARFAELVPKGRLVCIDRDPEILEKAKMRLAAYPNVLFVNASYSDIREVLAARDIGKIDGVLADLGISMYHVKEANRGFSYTDEAPPDMRFDPSQGISASDVVNTFKEKEIADILYNLGEERESRKIASYIVRSRPVKSSVQLAEIVRRAKKYSKGRIHPATQTFQALRIFVNEELKIIESFIPSCVDILCEKGRLAMMSFHSLEDRIVKWTFRRLEDEGLGTIVTPKPVTASETETHANPASRSAKLRVFEKGNA